MKHLKKNVTDLLKKDTNILRVHFNPAKRINNKKAELYPVRLPDCRAFSRKAPFQFGWDWAPELVTCGIWKPVYLYAWNDLRINDLQIFQDSISEGFPDQSTIDSFALKEDQYLYSNVIISFKILSDSVNVFVLSDHPDSIHGELVLTLLDFSGNELFKVSKNIYLKPNSVKKYYCLSKEILSKEKNKNEIFLNAIFKGEHNKISTENNLYFVKPKYLKLPHYRVDIDVDRKGRDYTIKLQSEVLVKNIFLSFDSIHGFFSDNYFDLLPGKERKVIFTAANKCENIKNKLKVISLNDIFIERNIEN